MKVSVPQTGGLCFSLRGRDRGRMYVIVRVGDGAVYVADGRYKTYDSPKKKNLKHVYLMPERMDIPDLKGKARDSEIYRYLKDKKPTGQSEDERA